MAVADAIRASRSRALCALAFAGTPVPLLSVDVTGLDVEAVSGSFGFVMAPPALEPRSGSSLWVLRTNVVEETRWKGALAVVADVV